MNSDLEELFARSLDAAFDGQNIPYERDYRFAAHHVGLGPNLRRRLEDVDLKNWHFDFAFLSQRVACEIDGGIYIGGRHLQPRGYINDCAKRNAAEILGWRVLVFPGPILEDDPTKCIRQLATLLNINPDTLTN